MEDGTIANGQAPPPTEDFSQVDFLLKELTASKSSISNLEAKVDAHEKERTEFLHKIEQLEDEAKAMNSVMARASSLEVDVARLQHDLVSAMSEGDEATAEAKQLRSENAALEKKVGALEGRVAILEAALGEKDGRIFELEAEKAKVAAEGEEAARGLVEKLRKAEWELGEKDGQIGEAEGLAAEAISEMEVLQRGLAELKESGKKPREEVADVGKESTTGGGGFGGRLTLLPYAATVVSAGTVAAAATVCYLRLSRER